MLKQRLNKPSVVVDLAKLGLAGINVAGNTVTIGAMTTHATVAEIGRAARRKFPASPIWRRLIGDEQVRHRGTIGGSLANNDPAACYPAAALALGAHHQDQQARDQGGRFLPGHVHDGAGAGRVDHRRSTFPVPEKSAYEKFRNPASRYADRRRVRGEVPAGVRLAITGAGQNGVFRHKEMEQALSANFSPDAIASISTPADGLNSDIHASAEYRAHLFGVMASRAVAKAT